MNGARAILIRRVPLTKVKWLMYGTDHPKGEGKKKIVIRKRQEVSFLVKDTFKVYMNYKIVAEGEGPVTKTRSY